MPTYQFQCDPDEGGCGHIMEIKCSFEDKKKNQPKSCPKCRKRKTIFELFGTANPVHIPVTLGSYADKKTAKMSEDEKHHRNIEDNKYKQHKHPGFIEGPEGRMIRNPDANRD